MNIRETIVQHVAGVVADHSSVPFPDEATDELRLDDFWLDSVAYTDLISRLEGAVGYIPTVILEGAFYPETLGELVSTYESASETKGA